jgi:hypothetical protein
MLPRSGRAAYDSSTITQGEAELTDGLGYADEGLSRKSRGSPDIIGQFEVRT